MKQPERSDNVLFGTITSDDPFAVNLPNTPEPVPCDYCGTLRFFLGIRLTGTIWWPGKYPKPCTCPGGQARAEAEQAELEAKRQREAEIELYHEIQRFKQSSGMGERFAQRTFDNFIAKTPEEAGILRIAKKYVLDFPDLLPKWDKPLPEKNGMILTGRIGIGKTHIAAAIANALLQKGFGVMLMTEQQLYGQIRDTYNRGRRNGMTESEVRRAYEKVQLLIIDDLGKEKASAWTLATLYAIIDGRYSSAMPIIVTTNYDNNTLIDKLTPAKYDTITAEAMIDRLTETCKTVNVTGKNRRKNL